MKKFSKEYFEKKYKILFRKLLAKKDFESSVIELRLKLGIPETGFDTEYDLAKFFLKNFTEDQMESLAFFTYATEYEHKNKIILNEENKELFIDNFIKDQKKISDKEFINNMILNIADEIKDHNSMIVRYPILKDNPKLAKLYPETMKLIQKFWQLDLLDEHIIGHFVEKYLFLGQDGVNNYIKNKVACSNCRYIGVQHFSPTRNNMKAKKEGAYGKNYKFNQETVNRLSLHFNSVFLIIKPYASKEEVLNYIDDNWDNLKEHLNEKNLFYKQFDVHPNVIKESDFERNQLIYEYYKLPKKELIKLYEGEEDFSLPYIYKEDVIAGILKDKHKIDMKPEAIKKSALRYAKNTSLKKKVKDIRDI